MPQFLLCVLLFFLPGSLSYGIGAPTTACSTMTPSHYGAQSSSSPYTIDLLGYASYRPGVPLSFRVTGGYRGILIQARRADGSSEIPVGTFKTFPDNLRSIRCSNNADSVTHSNQVPKTDDVKFEWNPPNEDVGDIKFVATIASSKNEYWLVVESNGVLSMVDDKTTPLATTKVAVTTPPRATDASTSSVPSTTTTSTTTEASTTPGTVKSTTTPGNGMSSTTPDDGINSATKLQFYQTWIILISIFLWQFL